VATTVKWQGRPHLAFANGVSGFRWYRNLLNASPRAFLDATVRDDRGHLRTITVPHRLGNRWFARVRFLRKHTVLSRPAALPRSDRLGLAPYGWPQPKYPQRSGTGHGQAGAPHHQPGARPHPAADRGRLLRYLDLAGSHNQTQNHGANNVQANSPTEGSQRDDRTVPLNHLC